MSTPTQKITDAERAWMQEALAMASTGVGHVWPNPSVGCIIVRDGVAIGRGRTAVGGRPHAERRALNMAGASARGSTVYVTLEPCAHWGVTPPCANALLHASVQRVFIALRDPDPRTNGTGIARLQAHGVDVRVGLGAQQAQEINRGFCKRVRTGRPLVGVTTATGEALAQVCRRWDAVAAHPSLPAALTPRKTSVAVGGISVVKEATWCIGAPALTGDMHIALPPNLVGAVRVGAALDALGARGLTRLLIHVDDPLAAHVAASGLVDLQID